LPLREAGTATSSSSFLYDIRFAFAFNHHGSDGHLTNGLVFDCFALIGFGNDLHARSQEEIVHRGANESEFDLRFFAHLSRYARRNMGVDRSRGAA
jgi:hypothetical protein